MMRFVFLISVGVMGIGDENLVIKDRFSVKCEKSDAIVIF
jgi:hypothetical protein